MFERVITYVVVVVVTLIVLQPVKRIAIRHWRRYLLGRELRSYGRGR
jgi:hypothetical protein